MAPVPLSAITLGKQHTALEEEGPELQDGVEYWPDASRVANYILNGTSQGSKYEIPPDKWIHDELVEFGVKNVKGLKKPRLSGEIHPVFAEDRWLHMSHDRYVAMLPALRLSTILLSLSMPYISSFLPAPSSNANNYPATKPIEVREHVSDEEVANTEEIFNDATELLRWQEDAKLYIPGGMYGYTSVKFPRPEKDSIVRDDPALFHGDAGGPTRALTVGIMSEYIDSILKAKATENIEMELWAQFHLAHTIVHELGHVIYLFNPEHYNEFGAEPTVGEDACRELGQALIARLFNRFSPEPIGAEAIMEKDKKGVMKKLFVHGMAWHYQFESKKGAPWWSTFYSIPSKHIERIMQNGTWEGLGPKFWKNKAKAMEILSPKTPFRKGKHARIAVSMGKYANKTGYEYAERKPPFELMPARYRDVPYVPAGQWKGNVQRKIEPWGFKDPFWEGEASHPPTKDELERERNDITKNGWIRLRASWGKEMSDDEEYVPPPNPPKPSLPSVASSPSVTPGPSVAPRLAAPKRPRSNSSDDNAGQAKRPKKFSAIVENVDPDDYEREWIEDFSMNPIPEPQEDEWNVIKVHYQGELTPDVQRRHLLGANEQASNDGPTPKLPGDEVRRTRLPYHTWTDSMLRRFTKSLGLSMMSNVDLLDRHGMTQNLITYDQYLHTQKLPTKPRIPSSMRRVTAKPRPGEWDEEDEHTITLKIKTSLVVDLKTAIFQASGMPNEAQWLALDDAGGEFLLQPEYKALYSWYRGKWRHVYLWHIPGLEAQDYRVRQNARDIARNISVLHAVQPRLKRPDPTNFRPMQGPPPDFQVWNRIRDEREIPLQVCRILPHEKEIILQARIGELRARYQWVRKQPDSGDNARWGWEFANLKKLEEQANDWWRNGARGIAPWNMEEGRKQRGEFGTRIASASVAEPVRAQQRKQDMVREKVKEDQKKREKAQKVKGKKRKLPGFTSDSSDEPEYGVDVAEKRREEYRRKTEIMERVRARAAVAAAAVEQKRQQQKFQDKKRRKAKVEQGMRKKAQEVKEKEKKLPRYASEDSDEPEYGVDMAGKKKELGDIFLDRAVSASGLRYDPENVRDDDKDDDWELPLRGHPGTPLKLPHLDNEDEDEDRPDHPIRATGTKRHPVDLEDDEDLYL